MKRSLHSLYVRSRKIIAPVIAETSSGYLDVEPVRILECDDHAGIARIVRESIETGNPTGRGYMRGEFPPPVVLKPTKSRSWAQFAKGTTCIGWEIYLDRCFIKKIGNIGLKGKSGYEWVIVQELARDVSIDVLVEAVLREIRLACEEQDGTEEVKK